MKELNEIEIELNSLVKNLTDPTNFIVKACSDLRSRIQLRTQEAIANKPETVRAKVQA